MKSVRHLNRYIWSTGAALAVVACYGTQTQVEAHDPNVTLLGAGTATMDGVLAPGEWDNAGEVTFAANVPALEGGGTTPATLYVMNDNVNLYLAVRVERPALEYSSVAFEFDNDHDGVREVGDDVVFVNGHPIFGSTFFDNFRGPCAGDPPDAVNCGPADSASGGSTDGAGAASNDGTYSVYELSHPLNSADDSLDFNLGAGDVVGFRLDVRLIVGEWPDGFGDTYFPTDCVLCADEFGDIIITPIPSAIDIKPSTPQNTINRLNKGTIPVAILSTPTFSAPGELDPATLTFGRTGDEQSLSHYSAADVNLDGLVDLVAHFHTPLTGFQPGDTVGILKGQLTSGAPFVGTDSVTIVN